VCFFHFCFVFSFLLQERRKRRRRYRRRKPIPSTLRRQEQHRYIILEHSSRVRINHHHQHERYLSVPSSKYYKKVCPSSRKAEKLENPKTPYCKNSKIQTEWPPPPFERLRCASQIRITNTTTLSFCLLRAVKCAVSHPTRAHIPRIHLYAHARTRSIDGTIKKFHYVSRTGKLPPLLRNHPQRWLPNADFNLCFHLGRGRVVRVQNLKIHVPVG